MLSNQILLLADFRSPMRQKGVVLLIALIMLVAMTLGGIALIRSVYSTNLIAGNMAFQQGATSFGDTGIQAAVNWLENNNTCTPVCNLNGNIFPSGYAAYRIDPAAGDTWDSFWKTLQVNQQIRALPADDSGNTVSYAIQRMCNKTGLPQDANCSISPIAIGSGGNDKHDPDQLNAASKIYYRITARVDGPRSTVSYVQAMVSM